MAVFVALGKATEQGRRNLEGLAARHKVAIQRAEAAGGKVVGSYALCGPYDYLVILEAPDTQTAMRVLVREASSGNVTYQTFAAVPMEEFAALVGE